MANIRIEETRTNGNASRTVKIAFDGIETWGDNEQADLASLLVRLFDDVGFKREATEKTARGGLIQEFTGGKLVRSQTKQGKIMLRYMIPPYEKFGIPFYVESIPASLLEAFKDLNKAEHTLKDSTIVVVEFDGDNPKKVLELKS